MGKIVGDLCFLGCWISTVQTKAKNVLNKPRALGERPGEGLRIISKPRGSPEVCDVTKENRSPHIPMKLALRRAGGYGEGLHYSQGHSGDGGTKVPMASQKRAVQTGPQSRNEPQQHPQSPTRAREKE